MIDKIKKDIGSIIFFAFVIIFFYVQTRKLNVETRLHVGRDVGVDFFPRFLLYSLSAFLLALVIKTLFNYIVYIKKRDINLKNELEKSWHEYKKALKIIVILMFVSFIYSWFALPEIGFIYSTIPFIYICSLIFGGRNYLKQLIFTLLTTFGLYFLFYSLLSVPLP